VNSRGSDNVASIPTDAEQSQSGSRTIRTSLAWLAGARSDVLDQSPSEIALYNTFGLAVLLTATMSGVAVAIVVGYVFEIPAAHLWPVATVWGLVILNADRALQILTTSKRLFLAFIPRILISLVIGILVAEPLMLRIFQPEINNQLQQTAQHAILQRTSAVAHYYGSQIQTDQQKISAMQSQERSVQAQVLQDQFLAACENGEMKCSTTHELGCGVFCHHYEQLAIAAQSRLSILVQQNKGTTKELEAQIQHLTAAEAHQTAQTTASINASNGLIAREDALTQIEQAHPGVIYEVWLIRVIFVLLDELALIIKLLHIAFGESSYERINAAMKHHESAKAHKIEVDTRVETVRISEQGLADQEVNRVIIQLQRDQRIADAECEWFASGERPTSTSARSSTSGSGIETMSLSEYARRASMHESMPVNIPAWLQVSGWVGTALIATTTVTLTIIAQSTHQMIPGEWLAWILLAGSVSLVVLTRGFRCAPSWGLRATFTALLMGLALPLVVLVLNL
jgi:hypothetical protein